MEKIIRYDSVTYKVVLCIVKRDRNILLKVKRRQTSWIVYILRMNCLVKHIFEGKIELRVRGVEGKGSYRINARIVEDIAN